MKSSDEISQGAHNEYVTITAGYEIKNTFAGDLLMFMKLVSQSNHVHKNGTRIEK